jgi:hypothetical protein
MFAWAPLPPRFAQLGSVEFSKLLLARAKVAVAPGLGFGEHGEGFVRIALVENTQRLRQAVRSIRAFLQAGTNQVGSAEAVRRTPPPIVAAQNRSARSATVAPMRTAPTRPTINRRRKHGATDG